MNIKMGNGKWELGSGKREKGSGKLSAFTLMELMVVVLIVSVLIGIAVPSFSSMLRSSEASMAETLLRNALRSGRDAALRSGSREDAAVVFFYNPGGKMSMLTCVKVGEIMDSQLNSPALVTREIFVPVDNAEPTQLPKYWTVRGFAPPNAVDLSWYERATLAGQPSGEPDRYGLNMQRGDWVFPETGFFNSAVRNDGRNRQSFMVRFEAGTGLVSAANGNAVLVFNRGIDLKARNVAPWIKYSNPLYLGNPRKYVELALTDNSITDTVRRNLIGAGSGDMMLVKPVKALAIGDERKLAAALGARVDASTGCLYAQATLPRFITVTGVPPNMVSQRIGQWIEGNGDLNGIGGVDSREPTYVRDPRIFLVDRFTSELRDVEVEP